MKFCFEKSLYLPKSSRKSNLNLSYKKDIDFFDCFGKKTCLVTKEIRDGGDKITLQLSYPCSFNFDFSRMTRARGYKTFFMLNSAEHEILNAHKYKNIKNFSIFRAHISRECYFSCS